ncbi:hypothetical protein [Frankia sp. Cas4]|uniref:hypothetical protein n=1 Tax=Frankia sp. Cas4 TaxID=3073927 RepID=UPI002AD5A081|nr:hypothetical protein [Frankia sp. Cas4]
MVGTGIAGAALVWIGAGTGTGTGIGVVDTGTGGSAEMAGKALGEAVIVLPLAVWVVIGAGSTAPIAARDRKTPTAPAMTAFLGLWRIQTAARSRDGRADRGGGRCWFRPPGGCHGDTP